MKLLKERKEKSSKREEDRKSTTTTARVRELLLVDISVDNARMREALCRIVNLCLATNDDTGKTWNEMIAAKVCDIAFAALKGGAK